jgi:uncharacterized circularly permuted ATP-grasp superfamily protein
MSSLPLPTPAAPAFAFAPQEPGDDPCWDELREPSGAMRPTWQRFLSVTPSLREDAAATFARHRAAIAQQIRADGVTHNLHEQAAPGVSARAWSLEALPLIVEAADWAQIERGVIQRAQLLSRMLADLYGPQRLLHDALLPPALVFRHSGYLRPVHGIRPADGMHLHIAAFDVARGVDGRWWVVSQRTQSPSGLGYVLHNRLIVSRLYPEAFRELRVQHIASSYRRLLDTVQQQAADVAARLGDGHLPRIALLSPGPYSETYFEHAYLARYLGLSLVEGADLTARGDRLFLRTVEGLEPVHGVIRRLDDDYCDPLELRPDSALGVAGLVQVARAGNVVMANALGSGFLESSAVQGFLPGISQALLGERQCGAAGNAARLCHRRQRTALVRAARRTDARGHQRAAVGVDAAGWHQPGHLGRGQRHRRWFFDVAAAPVGGRSGRAPRAGGQPHRREPVLDGPLHRAH